MPRSPTDRTDELPPTLHDAATPSLVIDRDRLETNLERMRQRAHQLDVDLRPHVKTAKCVEVAQRATSEHSGAITVSTLREAAFFAEHGFTDILYAVGIAPSKLDRAARLTDRGVQLTLLLDSRAAAKAVARHGAERDRAWRVALEIDCDGHRAGLAPDAPELVEVAQVLATDGAELAGVVTHAGSAYGCDDVEGIRAVAEQEREAVVQAAGRLRGAGYEVSMVSVGSTPTACMAEDLTGVTEMRPGVYTFFDLYQAGLGVCTVDEVALSVVATVIGHRNRDGAPIVDAGALALSKDRSTARFDDERDRGYGLVCALETCRPLDDGAGEVVVADPSQEHGVLVSRDGPPPSLSVGDRVRILPNHACITAAGYPGYLVADGPEVVDRWTRCNGW